MYILKGIFKQCLAIENNQLKFRDHFDFISDAGDETKLIEKKRLPVAFLF